jgi:hypothetical protein
MKLTNARKLVKDVLFALTYTAGADLLWNVIPISDMGISTEACPTLEKELGLNFGKILPSMTQENLAQLVARESSVTDTAMEGTVIHLGWTD